MVVRINPNLLQPGVTLTLDPMKFKLKELQFFTLEKNEPRLENKGIWGIILHVTKPTVVSNSVNQGNNRRQKSSYNQIKLYHRWILCADVLNPPHTFAMITQNHTTSYKFFQYVADQSL